MADLEVPEDQRHLPRAERHHPFRWLNDQERAEIRQAADDAIRGVTGMIRQIVARHAARTGFGRSHIEDVEQEVRLRLFLALPTFDRSYGVKVSTFLRVCISRSSFEHFRRLGRQRAKANVLPLDDLTAFAKDETHDRIIERLADRVRREPTLIDRNGATLLNTPAGQSDDATAASLSLRKSGLVSARFRSRKRAV